MGYADMYETLNVKHETINVMGYADMYGATTDTTCLTTNTASPTHRGKREKLCL